MAESPHRHLRPTQARVRKSLFQRLEPWGGRKVCDLYAGIGALGLEAISRGAEAVTFVENDPAALAVLRKNLRRANVDATVIESDVVDFLAGTSDEFDVVLADPPYGTTTWEQVWSAANLRVAAGGSLVMEMSRQAELPPELDVRIYGKSKIAIWSRPA